jgi:hypothetical protein
MLKVFGNIVPREIFGTKGQEVARDCRKLRNEELHNLYSTPNITRVIKLKKLYRRGMWHLLGEGNTNRVSVWKNEGKIPLGRLGNRWEESKD